MKKEILFIFILIIALGCQNESVNLDDPGPKMVPDHTPYIAGLIQATPDTTVHYPEVVVGYFSDHQSAHDPGILPRRHYPSIYNLTLRRQLVQTSIFFALSWQPESKAMVKIRGPLESTQEKEVTLTSEGKGVYGDESSELPRVANGRYRLRVILPDGRAYSSTTHIPDKVPVKMKDSVRANVVLKPYGDGTPREVATPKYHLLFYPPQNSFLQVIQHNTNRDRQLLFLKPGQKFLYADYGNYLRSGTAYDINVTKTLQPDTYNLLWGQDLNKPRAKIWSSEHDWLRFSFFSPGISEMFTPLYNFIGVGSKWDKKYDGATDYAVVHDDTTYLHRVSTIRKVGEDGKVLPQNSTDAIGFFAGEYSRYLQTTLYANRQFDLDSVLTAYNNNK